MYNIIISSFHPSKGQYFLDVDNLINYNFIKEKILKIKVLEKEAFEKSGKPANFQFEKELVETFEEILLYNTIKY